MNADECGKRADECLAAAQYASDRDVQRTWRQLADMWLLWAEQLEKFGVNNERSVAAAANAENGARTVAAAEPIEPVISGKAAEIADRLRSMLTLNEMNDA